MSKLIGRLIGVLVYAGCVGAAQAAFIGSKDIVHVNGREWAQVDLFVNQSWNNMSAKCPLGVCAGEHTFSSGTWDLTGWMWANVDDVDALFNAYLAAAGVPESEFMSGHDMVMKWGKPFVNEVFFAPGAFRTINSGPYGRGTGGFIYGEHPGGAGVSQIDETYNEVWSIYSTLQSGSENPDEVLSTVGAFLYRDAIPPVPLPATLLLLGLGLAVLGIIRRKNKAYC